MTEKKPRRVVCAMVAGVMVAGLSVGTQVADAQDDAVGRAQRDAAAEAADQHNAAVAAIQADRERVISDIVNRLAPHDATGQFESNLKLATAEQLYEISEARSFDQASRILLFGSATGKDPLGVIAPEQLAIGQTNQDFVYTPVALAAWSIPALEAVGCSWAARTGRSLFMAMGRRSVVRVAIPRGVPRPGANHGRFT